ncbi:hypothetical protein [Castellaniella defragrans]|uniref:Calcium-binding protein n=2 Tax=Castellaniella defragrans TaxID=75697 RepID=A0A7W9TMV2_CASDE|nr:hypothetical protein [Castellaniella defragrans]MBB6082307.1 hypothetical protein [Castellaniella defragrans]
MQAGLTTAYDHFLLYGIQEDRSPLIVFDPEYYLALNPDVAAAVGDGMNAVQHFLQYGSGEVRALSPFIDLAAYLGANPDVAAAVDAGQTTALQHLMSYGVLEGRDLGNGIVLSIFQSDAQFVDALTVGNYDLALARVYAIAPFLPSFQPPEGWVPAADTPIPVDFVPPEGIKLVVPPGVHVPPALLPLPDTFEQDRPDDDPGGGGGGPAFTVSDDGHGHYTLGSLHGDVTVTLEHGAYVFTPARGVAVSVPQADVASLIVNDITLSGLGPVISGMQIAGTGGVVVQQLQDQKSGSSMNADLSGLTTVRVDAYYDVADGSTISPDAKLGTASVWIESSKGDGSLSAGRPNTEIDLGTATLNLADGVTLTATMAQLGNAHVQGLGKVNVNRFLADSDLSRLADSLTVTVIVSSGMQDATDNPTLAVVDLFTVNSAMALTLTADQADGRPIEGKGVVTILGSEGDQVLTVSTTGIGAPPGTNFNFIAGGLGADRITLGEGEDVLIVDGPKPAAAQETTLTFSTLSSDYGAGAQLSVTIDGVVITAGVVASDVAGSLGALASAINASLGDSGGLNGVLQTLDAGSVDAGKGEVTLVASTPGWAGAFTVDAGAAGVATRCPEDAQPVSDSPAIDAGWDVVTGFTAGQDHILLSEDSVVQEDGSISIDSQVYTISNGRVLSVGTVSLDAILQALGAQMTVARAAVAFEHGGHTYVFQSDGAAGLAMSDTLIQLSGVTGLSNLCDILVSLGVP